MGLLLVTVPHCCFSCCFFTQLLSALGLLRRWRYDKLSTAQLSFRVPEPNEAMAISSTDSQTAAAPTVEVPVANETDPTPADEGEPKPDTSNTVTSRRLSAPAAARKHSRHAPRAACAPHRSQHES